ncbi:Crp/Fnr family transcriptional regulator [Salidesulfovibrio onnuriiensis]|uniref:Crp/Fnr family transcriptional regulator n=1 Tax=Salidesulfovibrio onnuriiensis TaxID=2583823 RepID=UPI0011C98683|nr:cyclic nucleotide-binding domain-containing protein [Salidesulfovibrio onnuriiensis]
MPLLGQQPTMPMKQVSHGHFLSRTMLKHNVVFHEGSHGDSAYILIRGQVEISGNVDGRKKVFAILNPVSIFGEMALFLDDQARTATAICLEDSEVIEVTRDDLDDYLRTAPQVISSILTVLVARLKATTKKAMHVPSIPMAVVRTLDLFAQNDCTTIGFEQAVRSMADTLVSSPETITGYLFGLANEGFVTIEKDERERRVIRIKHHDLLHQVIQSRKKKE